MQTWKLPMRLYRSAWDTDAVKSVQGRLMRFRADTSKYFTIHRVLPSSHPRKITRFTATNASSGRGHLTSPSCIETLLSVHSLVDTVPHAAMQGRCPMPNW